MLQVGMEGSVLHHLEGFLEAFHERSTFPGHGRHYSGHGAWRVDSDTSSQSIVWTFLKAVLFRVPNIWLFWVQLQGLVLVWFRLRARHYRVAHFSIEPRLSCILLKETLLFQAI